MTLHWTVPEISPDKNKFLAEQRSGLDQYLPLSCFPLSLPLFYLSFYFLFFILKSTLVLIRVLKCSNKLLVYFLVAFLGVGILYT